MTLTSYYPTSAWQDSSRRHNHRKVISLLVHLALECEDHEDDYEKHTISRPSDIWSFGCILLECLTYLLDGAQGVIEFEKKRKVRLGNVTTYTFHAGPSSVNSGVVAWMLQLQYSASSTVPQLLNLLSLVKRMLVIEPTQRPSAFDTMLTLRHAYLAMSYRQLCESFECGYTAHDNYELKPSTRDLGYGAHYPV